MPRVARNESHHQRGAGGIFTSNFVPTITSESDSGAEDDTMWESDTESDIKDPDYFEAWEALPVPRTYDERMEEKAVKKEKAAAKHRIAKMQGVEHKEAGSTNNHMKGKKRGVYGVGGLAPRTIQERKKALKDNFKAGLLAISEEELKRQLAAIDTLAAPASTAPVKAQPTILSMFAKASATQKRPRASSLDDDIQEIPAHANPSKRPRTDSVDTSVSAPPSISQREEEEESSSEESAAEDEEEIAPEELEERARETDGDEAIDSIAIADNVAEWVDSILDDAAPLDPDELRALAADGLNAARKNKDYRSTVLFASLVDFYRWKPRMGRLRAALRVSLNHGRGPAFQPIKVNERKLTAFLMTRGSSWAFNDGFVHWSLAL
ncbi:hypothetical protein K438DRAFT_2119523 [Mycena galopus ATCC 62051]|nr:hypothetical protein K438DRAFT_2119523 [Mycena galopus ATCC 62051]